MDYQTIYNNLIYKRQLEPASGYTENHHIIMRSMGGNNNPENLVRLTAREHWIAHLLLHKIHCNSKTAWACHMMGRKHNSRICIKKSRMYEAIRKECARFQSISAKKLKGSKNGSYGSFWVRNPNSNEDKRVWSKDDIPEGWVCGKYISEKQKNDISNTLKGIKRKPLSEEHKKKIGKSVSKALSGKILSKEHKKKISQSLVGKKYPTVKCPYCDKSGNIGNMNRWHFDNCKFKNTSIV